MLNTTEYSVSNRPKANKLTPTNKYTTRQFRNFPTEEPEATPSPTYPPSERALLAADSTRHNHNHRQPLLLCFALPLANESSFPPRHTLCPSWPCQPGGLTRFPITGQVRPVGITLGFSGGSRNEKSGDPRLSSSVSGDSLWSVRTRNTQSTEYAVQSF